MSRWISTDVRLPEDYTEAIITFANVNPVPYYEHIKGIPMTGFAIYFMGQWRWWSPTGVDILKEYGKGAVGGMMSDDIKVIAWQQMPEPYEAESYEADGE